MPYRNAEQRKRYSAEYYIRNRERILARMKAKRQQVKEAVEHESDGNSTPVHSSGWSISRCRTAVEARSVAAQGSCASAGA